jgi:hypothetical protein
VGLKTPHSKKLIVTKFEQRKSWMDLTMMERVGDGWEKMEGSCSTGQSPQWAVVPVEEEEEEEEEEGKTNTVKHTVFWFQYTNEHCYSKVLDGLDSTAKSSYKLSLLKKSVLLLRVL